MRSKSVKTLNIVFIVLIFVSLQLNAQKTYATNKNETKKILVLHSYHQGFHWTDRIHEGILDVLGSDNAFDLYITYMDSKKCASDSYFGHLKSLYKEKYKDYRFDAIISTDDNALHFLNKYRDSIFGAVPLIFCGINNYSTVLHNNLNYTTGVYENYDIKGTIQLIKSIHPGTKNICVISDSTTSGIAFLQRFNKIENQFTDLNLIFLNNLEISSLESNLRNLPENTVIIWSIYILTPEGQSLSTKKSINLVTANSSLPVYCVWDIVGKGVIGGKVTSPHYQGTEASKLTKQILLDKKNINHIVPYGSPMIYKFDYNKLYEHKIALNLIPDGSEIINQKHSFYEENKALIYRTVIVFIILIILLIVFMFLYRKAEIARRELKINNKELQLLSQKLSKTNNALSVANIEAKKSERLKTAFLANLSHEIRTPMNGIIGFYDLLQNQDIEPNKHEQFSEIIRNSCDNLLLIIEKLINISKIESKTIELNLIKTDIHNLIKYLYKSYLKKVENKGIELILENSENPKQLIINADAGKLNQILIYTLNNAIRFSPTGRIILGYSTKNHEIHFYVSDNGSGIDENTLNNIFKKFTNDENPNVDKNGGLGVALSISKAFAEIMNGKFWIESELGKGTTINFTVPIIDQKI